MSERELVTLVAFWTFVRWYCLAVIAANALAFVVEIFRAKASESSGRKG